MAQFAKLRGLFFSSLWPAVSIMLLLVFASYAVLGPSGLFAWGDYTQQLKLSHVELSALDAQRQRLRNRVALLDRQHTDPDLADELVRAKLGVTHPDDLIIPLD